MRLGKGRNSSGADDGSPTPKQTGNTPADAELAAAPQPVDPVGAQIAELWATLTERANRRMPDFASRTVVSLGGKGGGSKTTSAAWMARVLSDVLPRLTLAVDMNPVFGSLLSRLVAQPAVETGSLVELAHKLDQVHYPTQLAAYLDVTDRLHVLHNTHVSIAEAKNVTDVELRELLARLALLAQLVVLDTGQDPTDRWMEASMGAADHVVVGATAVQSALRNAHRVITELDGMGWGHLMQSATVIVGVHSPDIDPARVSAQLDWFRDNCGQVFVVPYDPALVMGNLIRWDQLNAATVIPILQAAIHVADSFGEPPASHRAVTPKTASNPAPSAAASPADSSATSGGSTGSS